jgi:glc operon protein GlcG
MIAMNLAMAERIARATLAKAAAIGANMTVSVVDESGRLVLTMKGDKTGFFTTETSRAKAAAAVAFKRPTAEMIDLAKQYPTFWPSLPALSRGELLPSIGAVPVVKDGRVIGAVGCGGGTGEQDHECASAGVAAA